jgi:hypothetical protein
MLRKKLSANKAQQATAGAYRDLIRKEAVIGGTLFGPIPSGHRREFFCLDKHTWVWHEEWIDKSGVRQLRNTHYSVRPSGVVKIHSGSRTYQALSPTEAKNFRGAVDLYYKKVTHALYSQVA